MLARPTKQNSTIVIGGSTTTTIEEKKTSKDNSDSKNNEDEEELTSKVEIKPHLELNSLNHEMNPEEYENLFVYLVEDALPSL